MKGVKEERKAWDSKDQSHARIEDYADSKKNVKQVVTLQTKLTNFKSLKTRKDRQVEPCKKC